MSHLLDDLGDDALSPSKYWNFSDEDMMGVVKRLSRAVGANRDKLAGAQSYATMRRGARPLAHSLRKVASLPCDGLASHSLASQMPEH
eukprot:13861193-Alexandrium_andersonii.AAC.1